MVTNIQRIRVYYLAIVVVVIVIGVVFNISAARRLSDLRLLNEVRVLSYALERYKLDFWRYPPADSIDLRQAVMLSENGFAPGTTLYYQGRMPTGRAITYKSDEKSYSIAFTLKQSWPDQGIPNNKCTIRERYTMTCGEQ